VLTEAERTGIFDAHYTWARKVAWSIVKKRGLARNELDGDAMVNSALMSMWQALRRYDPSRAPFRTFAYLPIHAGVIDEVRRLEGCRRRAACV
jgi:DNA-directed RNA polymerase specialized sigma24 family protein